MAVGCLGVPPERVFIERVVDGDTVQATDAIRFRLFGIDAPERGMCGAREAEARLRALVEGRWVEVEDPDGQRTFDAYGRRLADLWQAHGSTGLRLLEDGWARRTHHALRNEDYGRAEARARDQERGMWGLCGASE